MICTLTEFVSIVKANSIVRTICSYVQQIPALQPLLRNLDVIRLRVRNALRELNQHEHVNIIAKVIAGKSHWIG